MKHKGMTTDVDLHRFGNAVQFCFVDDTPTLYVAKHTARDLAHALLKIADDIDNKTYAESSITKIVIR